MRRAAAFALAAAGLLLGCSAIEPYETVPATLKPRAVTPAGTRIGICYDFAVSSAPKVAAAGQAACPAGTTAERVHTDYDMMNCPLLLPGRATFVCAPKK